MLYELYASLRRYGILCSVLCIDFCLFFNNLFVIIFPLDAFQNFSCESPFLVLFSCYIHFYCECCQITLLHIFTHRTVLVIVLLKTPQSVYFSILRNVCGFESLVESSVAFTQD